MVQNHLQQAMLEKQKSTKGMAEERKKQWYTIAQYTWIAASWTWAAILVVIIVGFAINFLVTTSAENSLAKITIEALQSRTSIGHVPWYVILLILVAIGLIITLLAFVGLQQLTPGEEVKGGIDMAERDAMLAELKHMNMLLEQTASMIQTQYSRQVLAQHSTTQALNIIHQVLQRLYQKSLEPVKIHPDHLMQLTEQAQIVAELQRLEQLIEDAQASDTQQLATQTRWQEPVVQTPLQEPVVQAAQQEPAEQEQIPDPLDQSALQQAQDTQEIAHENEVGETATLQAVCQEPG
ncbi:MAG TPA: hypothetical protein VL485_15805 [Ktedonobacteraceae bacterium]|jgi:hypothetical protein|nr:hypothetical protein [Ktedonobacteraceae bacterium]